MTETRGAAPGLGAVRLDVAGKTDVGKVRARNEDAHFLDAKSGVFIVADGMGGHAGGEFASQQAVKIISAYMATQRHILTELARDTNQEARDAASLLLEQSIQRACAELFRIGQWDETKRGMGTTVVVLALAGNKGVVGHVGDSRVYLVRNGECHRLTEDHTLVSAQLKAGAITAEQAAASRLRNVIIRAVGTQESVQVDTLVVDIVPGDCFILCSDGLHGYVREDEIAATASSLKPNDIVDHLINLANSRGGRDNITAIAVVCSSNAPDAVERVADAQSQMQALQRIPLFSYLSSKEQLAVLSTAFLRNFESNRQIITEDQVGEELFVVLRGRVAVEKGGVVIAELEEGGHFGEMGLVDDVPRSATVRTLEPTRVMVIARGDLMRIMTREPILAVKLLWNFVQALSDRLRLVNADLSSARQELALGPSKTNG